MKPADSTGFSGLLNPRRSADGNPVRARRLRLGRLPTPSPGYARRRQRARAVDVAVRVAAGPAPAGSPYGARATHVVDARDRDPGAVGRGGDHRAGTGLFSRVQVPA